MNNKSIQWDSSSVLEYKDSWDWSMSISSQRSVWVSKNVIWRIKFNNGIFLHIHYKFHQPIVASMWDGPEITWQRSSAYYGWSGCRTSAWLSFYSHQWQLLNTHCRKCWRNVLSWATCKPEKDKFRKKFQHKVIRGIKDINKCGRGQWTIDEYESNLRELLRPGTYYNPQSPYNLLFTQH